MKNRFQPETVDFKSRVDFKSCVPSTSLYFSYHLSKSAGRPEMLKSLCTELKTVLEIYSSCIWEWGRMMGFLFCVSMAEHPRLVCSRRFVCFRRLCVACCLGRALLGHVSCHTLEKQRGTWQHTDRPAMAPGLVSLCSHKNRLLLRGGTQSMRLLQTYPQEWSWDHDERSRWKTRNQLPEPPNWGFRH